MKKTMSSRTGSILARLACAVAFVGSVAYAAPMQESAPIGDGGGTLATLSFAIVGDCRPPNEDDVAGYPTKIITRIWQDIEASSPRPAFAITPGNYMFANPDANPGTQDAQLDDYLAARANFHNIVFPAMGNDECTGAADSNCGAGGADGDTANYNAFVTKMLKPIRKTLPYYAIPIKATNDSWTAKFVFIASNAWSTAQARWLNGELAKPTTYTFIVMNAGTSDTTAPCWSATGSNNVGTIIGKYPYTLLIVGHDHTFAYYSSEKEVVVGNGGAPLSGTVDYGYVIARQQGTSIVFTEYDYETNIAQTSFTVQ